MMRAIPTRVVEVTLVDLHLQSRLCVPGIDADDGQSQFIQLASPTRATFGACDLMNIAIASGSEETTPSRSIFPVRSTMQIAVSFNDTSSPT
jgi:hypothetical protein